MRRGILWVIGVSLVSGGVALAAAPVTDYWTWLWQERVRAHQASAKTANTDFTEVYIKNKLGKQVAGLLADDFGNGLIAISEPQGLVPRGAMGVNATGGGRVMVWSSAGVPAFGIDGDIGVVTFTADVAEVFPSVSDLPEGTVVVIEPERRGLLTASRVPYDRRVAGVVAGTTSHRPAMTLNAGSTAEQKATVTLTGTVYCLATNANGPIRAGDLLTTSALAGHAMKVTDFDAAHGAVLGKAMEDLQGASGRILILASLQ